MYKRRLESGADKKNYWYLIGLADPGQGMGSSFFFSKQDLKAAVLEDSLRSIDVWLEHGDATKEVIGTVVYAWVDDTDGLYVVIEFDNSQRSQAVKAWIKSGLYTGLSLGYKSTFDKNYSVKDKKIYEVSIVHKPFHNPCRIKQIIDADCDVQAQMKLAREKQTSARKGSHVQMFQNLFQYL